MKLTREKKHGYLLRLCSTKKKKKREKEWKNVMLKPILKPISLEEGKSVFHDPKVLLLF